MCDFSGIRGGARQAGKKCESRKKRVEQGDQAANDSKWQQGAPGPALTAARCSALNAALSAGATRFFKYRSLIPVHTHKDHRDCFSTVSVHSAGTGLAKSRDRFWVEAALARDLWELCTRNQHSMVPRVCCWVHNPTDVGPGMPYTRLH